MTTAKSSAKASASRAKAFAEDKIRTGRAAAKQVGRKAGDNIDSYPVAALIGGLAIGVVVGALLPRTRQEDDLLGTVGEAINERAREAVNAARDAGSAKLGELGISTDAAGKQVGKLIDSVAKVAETASTAAIDAVRP